MTDRLKAIWYNVRKRASTIYSVVRRWYVAFAATPLAFIGAYDLILSQAVPTDLSKHFPRLYEVVGMTSALPLWLLLIATILVAASAIEYAHRRVDGVSHTAPRDPVTERSLLSNSVIPPLPAPKPATAPVKIYENLWPHVFNVDLAQNDINLLILPDTKHQNQDAICLIAFGAKLFLGMDEMSEEFLRQKLLNAINTAPNARSGAQVLDSVYTAIAPIYVLPKIVQLCVEAGDLTRIKLSQGGLLTLTWYAETRAHDLADDLERRA